MHLEFTSAGRATVSSTSSTSFSRFRLSAVIALAGLCFGSFAHAANVFHNADDGAGFSGFGANTNWTPSGTPSAGNNYSVVNFTLRTGGGTGPQLFAGDSLSFIDGGRFYLANGASTDVITVNNLNLDAAVVRTANASIQSGLAGNIKVTSNGAIFYQSNLTNAYINLSANISDASANGFIALGGNDGIGGGATNKRITVSGTNTYSGQTLLLGGNIQLASAGALPSTTNLVFGSANTANSNGNATLDLNGGSYSVAGIAVQSYTAQLNQAVTLPYPEQNPTGIPVSNNRIFHLTNPIVPGSIKIGQTVTDVLSTGTPATTMVVGIDYTTNDVILGDQTGFNNTTANITGLNFNATQPVASGQVIGNSSITSDATLTITGTSSFAGNIVDSVLADPNVAGSGGTKKTNIAFTAPNGTLTLTGANTYTGTTSLPVASSTLVLDYTVNRSYSGAITGLGSVTKSSGGALTLSGANTYSGTTTVNGGGLTLDFSAAGAPTSNIINNTANNSALVLNGTNLTVKGGATVANTQQFNGLTLGAGSSSIVLTTNATPQALALNVGNITRSNGGVLLLTNPSGTVSATNGLLTSIGNAGALVTSNGAPYIVVGGTDWGAKDASNQFVTALSSYTASTATTLSGDANVVTDVSLAAGGATSSIRFNDSADHTVTIASGTLTTGGVLMTSASGNGTIAGGALSTTGTGADLVLVQNNAAKTMTISSNILDNGGSSLTAAGPGTITLSGQNSYTGKTSVGSGTVNFTKENSLYNNSPASWTASNISVNGNSTLGLSVGGPGEFTASDVAILSALGTATSGLKNGATLALDTTNAAGGVFTLTSPITNVNGGANVVNLKKVGINTLQLAAGPNTYTGTTTVSKGTLQLTGNNSLTGNSIVTMGNDATATLDLNGFNTNIGGLTGGGTTGGTVSLGAGSLTVNSSANATYAGSFTSAGGAVNFNLGNLGSNATTQTLTGGGMTGGNLTVANGTVAITPASATTWGSATTNTTVAPGNGSAGVLTIGTPTNGTTTNLLSQYITVGGDPADALNNANGFNPTGSGAGTGGAGTLNITSATAGNIAVKAQTLFIGSSARPPAAVTQTVTIGNATAGVNTTVELTGTTFPAFGLAAAGGNLDGRSFAITMATNQNQTANLNIAGANTQVKIENGSSIVMGRYYATTATITQSGGNVTFYSDAGTTVGGTGALIFDTDNPTGNAQNYRYNLNGGTLTVPQIMNANTFSINTTGNPTAALVLNGGTLAAAAHAGDFIGDFITGSANGYVAPPEVRVGNNGGTIETNGATVQINAGIFHDPAATNATDGGLTVKSSVPGGILVLNPIATNANSAAGAVITANTFTGPVNIVSGTLQTQSIGALARSSLLTVGASGKFDVNLMPSGPSIPAKLTLSGTGHVVGQFSLAISNSAITAGGVGTAGTLTFDNSLDLAGGVLRADLDQTAASYDKVNVTQNGGFGASGNPGGSVVDIEFMGALPTVLTTYSIVNYQGLFNGLTNPVQFNGNTVVNPTNLVFTSSNASIAGRNTQLSVNDTNHTLDIIYNPNGGVAGNLIWTGGLAHNSTVWDTNLTANWNNTTASTNPDKFLIRDLVTFDNSAGVPHAITLAGTIAPQTMTVNSDGANAYSFTGTGKISGTGSLTKSGTSTLTLGTFNDYTGGSTINNGTVVLLDVGSVPGVSSGLGNGIVNIAAGAVVQAGDGTTPGAGTISGSIIHNAGSVIVNRNDSSTLSAPMDGAGTFTVKGGGVLTVSVAANANIYSGNTTVSGGATLQAGAANVMSANSVINLDNAAGSRFNPNGFDQIVAGLSGGGANSGDITLGTNNLTFAGIGTNNLTYSGPISNSSGTIFMGRVQNVNDEGNPTTSRSVALTSSQASQTLGGAVMNLQGPITVRVGTLNLAPSVPTTIGTTARSISITAPITLPFGTGTSTPPNQQPPSIDQVAQATLTTNENTMLFANNLTLNPGQNSLSTFVQNGGTVQVNGTVSLGNSAGGSTLTLNNGSFIANGGGNVNGALASIQMGINGGQQAGAPPLTRPYEFNVLNVNGGTMSILNQLSMGLFFNAPCTVNQNGGTIQFVDGSLNPGGTGGWICINNNNANFGRYVWNLNGGVLAMNQAKIFLTADANPLFNTLNLNPVMNFNGGTLQAISDQPTEMFDHRYSLVAQAKGGTIDTHSHFLNFTAPISHDTALGSTPDGGITIVDSAGGGNLTYSIANTYTGPTNIGTGATLTLGLANAIPTTSTINLSGGKLLTGGFNQNMSASAKLKVSGNSTLDLVSGGNIQFADSSLSHWANASTVTINAAGGHINVGTSNTSLTPNQLREVTFSGSAAGAILSPTGELQPGTPSGTIEKLGDVNHDGTTNAADIPALLSALTDLNAYTNNLTLDPGWTSKASEALYLADVNFDDQINNLDIQSLLFYLKNGGNGSNAPPVSNTSPVPEPSTWLLLAVGGLIAGGRRLCRKS